MDPVIKPHLLAYDCLSAISVVNFVRPSAMCQASYLEVRLNACRRDVGSASRGVARSVTELASTCTEVGQRAARALLNGRGWVNSSSRKGCAPGAFAGNKPCASPMNRPYMSGIAGLTGASLVAVCMISCSMGIRSTSELRGDPIPKKMTPTGRTMAEGFPVHLLAGNRQ